MGFDEIYQNPVWAPRLDGVQVYRGEQAGREVERLFGARMSYGGDENLSIEDGALVAHYPAGSISPSSDQAPLGGAGFYAPVPDLGDMSALSYEVQFDPGFRFRRGGKLPGLYSRSAPSGGRQADGTNGFSVRLMWRVGGAGEIYAYVANHGGRPFGWSIGSGLFTFAPGRWTRIGLEVSLNTPGTADGRMRLWIAGNLVVDQDGVMYRTDPTMAIDGLMFSTFFGGRSEAWASPISQSARFRNFRIFVADTAGDPAAAQTTDR